MSKPIFVTGATGNVGQAVIALLSEQSIPMRIAARSPPTESSSSLAQTVHFDFTKPETYAPAISGCRAVFLLRPPAIANTKQTLNPFIDIAYESGAEQIVFVSVTGADQNPFVPHHAVEQHLKACNRTYTILRPGFFAQNLGDAYRTDIVADHRIYLPAGTGKVCFIDARDIAEVAVLSLCFPEQHQGKGYTLVGPEALAFHQVAELLSQQLNQQIIPFPFNRATDYSIRWVAVCSFRNSKLKT
ncbi:MAG: NAD(P)H-binding protein [Leptolyngbya sp. IPPAS B-1204]|nr:NAD(P)H-binding protein [Elainella sp. C42_A2020_010]RNJ69728.1 MAG: SDR family NAD(P)-dependent oxidoreductase [Leptolyngbya sp. IPPAS B-1204]